jgi:hypothetical protein
MMPALQVSEAEAQTMMALSTQDGNADPNAEVLTKENNLWDIWGEDDKAN